MDEQFKNLKFDMDEEIDARNEREGRRVHNSYRAHPPMPISHAIILAAIIVVGGLWGGKLLYDHWQAKQMEAALVYAAKSFKTATQDSERLLQQQIKQAQRQATLQQEQLEQQRKETEKANALRLAQTQKEQRMQSPECQFWWQQHSQNPTERTAAKKRQYCGR